MANTQHSAITTKEQFEEHWALSDKREPAC